MKYEYNHPDVLGQDYYEINKSKFIGYLIECKTLTTFKLHHNALMELHPKATHICYAYKILEDGQKAKAFDDGEPKGTAGYPILNLLEKHEMNNKVLFVVRYFGGTKLGAGPLLRAYVKVANQTIFQFKKTQ